MTDPSVAASTARVTFGPARTRGAGTAIGGGAVVGLAAALTLAVAVAVAGVGGEPLAGAGDVNGVLVGEQPAMSPPTSASASGAGSLAI
jgi:hypothetical protein